MQRIRPCLWFDTQAEAAAAFYVSLFEDSEIAGVMRGPDGAAIGVDFRLAGQEIQALNGGPRYTLSPAFSMSVRCADQAEVDRLWTALTEGGEEQPCAWLVDRFGLSWQIVPDRLYELLNDPDPERAQRAMQAMLQMRKIDVAALEAAADGR
jgi:predicted 3-demethylubiquinone-9 3-methyltransferase (glyoxalase superfamily)